MLQPWNFAAFSNISLETFMPNLVSLTPLSPQILVKTQMGVIMISRFLVNPVVILAWPIHSKTSGDIDTKLGSVAKFNKRNKTTSKKFDDDVMSVNCNFIINFSIYGQFGAIRKLDSGRIVCKTYICLIVTFYLTRTYFSKFLN